MDGKINAKLSLHLFNWFIQTFIAVILFTIEQIEWTLIAEPFEYSRCIWCTNWMEMITGTQSTTTFWWYAGAAHIYVDHFEYICVKKRETQKSNLLLNSQDTSLHRRFKRKLTSFIAVAIFPTQSAWTVHQFETIVWRFRANGIILILTLFLIWT